VAVTVLYMSISLDGFIAGPNEGPDNGLGDGGNDCTIGRLLMSPGVPQESRAARLG
jgi:hypothetical protein